MHSTPMLSHGYSSPYVSRLRVPLRCFGLVSLERFIAARESISREETRSHRAEETRQAPYLRRTAVSCVRAPLLRRNWGVWSVPPHWDEYVWVEGKTRVDVSAGLSSSSFPVGQEDSDGSLSAGLWWDPSPELPRSTHTGNWSWQEVGMHPSPLPLHFSPIPLSSLLYFSLSHRNPTPPACGCYSSRGTPPWHSSSWLLYHVFLI